MNEFPRNPKPNRGDIIEITECLSGRPSKYLYVGARIKVHRCWQRCDILIHTVYRNYLDKYAKMIHFSYRSPKGNLLGITERNYSWKIVERSTYIDLSELKVPKEEFDNLLRLMFKKREESSMIIDSVNKMNKVLSNFPYPEKDKSHEDME